MKPVEILKQKIELNRERIEKFRFARNLTKANPHYRMIKCRDKNGTLGMALCKSDPIKVWQPIYAFIFKELKGS